MYLWEKQKNRSVETRQYFVDSIYHRPQIKATNNQTSDSGARFIILEHVENSAGVTIQSTFHTMAGTRTS